MKMHCMQTHAHVTKIQLLPEKLFLSFNPFSFFLFFDSGEKWENVTHAGAKRGGRLRSAFRESQSIHLARVQGVSSFVRGEGVGKNRERKSMPPPPPPPRGGE